jgi:hypothetical protein
VEAEQQFHLILKNGWRQGSIISSELAREAKLPTEETCEQHYIVTSHSCDLTNPGADAEPIVDVVRADVIPAPEQNSESSKNPRKLVLKAQTPPGNEICLLARIATRQSIERHLFIRYQPDARIWLPADEIKMLALWMSRRYKRPELPTQFVNRLGKKYEKLKKLSRKAESTFSRILVSLNSWEELSEDQQYKVKFLGLLKPGVDVPQAAKEWATQIDRLLDEEIQGLEIEPAQVESESDLPISTLRDYKPFDFDYLSFAHGELDLIGDF